MNPDGFFLPHTRHKFEQVPFFPLINL